MESSAVSELVSCLLGAFITGLGLTATILFGMGGKPLAAMAAVAGTFCWLPIFLLGRHHAKLRRR